MNCCRQIRIRSLSGTPATSMSNYSFLKNTTEKRILVVACSVAWENQSAEENGLLTWLQSPLWQAHGDNFQIICVKVYNTKRNLSFKQVVLKHPKSQRPSPDQITNERLSSWYQFLWELPFCIPPLHPLMRNVAPIARIAPSHGAVQRCALPRHANIVHFHKDWETIIWDV